jgi:hypothetical protein
MMWGGSKRLQPAVSALGAEERQTKKVKEKRKTVSQQAEESVKLDFSGFKEAMIEANRQLVEQIVEALREKQTGGKGQLASGQKLEHLLESLHKVKEDNWKLTEQWTVVIPNYTSKETSAGMRDFVWVDEILKGEPGDVANIPYVKDADFEQLGAVGNAFSAETTGLISSVTPPSTSRDCGATSTTTSSNASTKTCWTRSTACSHAPPYVPKTNASWASSWRGRARTSPEKSDAKRVQTTSMPPTLRRQFAR